MLFIGREKKKDSELYHKCGAARSQVTAAFPKVIPARSLCTITGNVQQLQKQQEQNCLSVFFMFVFCLSFKNLWVSDNMLALPHSFQDSGSTHWLSDI